jgi:hypothetical protein
MASASSDAVVDQPPARLCPCGLPREEITKYNFFSDKGICTAVWADESGLICGKPLGAHPRQPEAGKPPMIIVECRVNGPSHCPILLYLIGCDYSWCQPTSGVGEV